MKVSVVLTTYNGEKYLLELLDSLRMQTRTIDEVLICDDGSTDNTAVLIKNYIKEYRLDNWKMIINLHNKGWKKNFRDGILMARGEFVFPCDQDDVWEKNKIERMVGVMSLNKEIMLLASDYRPLYETGGQKVEEVTKVAQNLEKIPFDYHFATGNRPGCVMCVCRTLIETVRPIWEEWYPHDAFLWTSAIFMNGCYIVHEPLVNYRRHSGNATNHVTRNKTAVVLSLKRNSRLVDLQLESNHSEENVQLLMKYKEYAKMRLELLEEKKVTNFFKLIPYKRFYRSLKQELGDLYFLMK